MSTKKKHLVAGAVSGGLLLAATMHSANTFALDNSTSTPDAPSGASTQTPSTTSGDPSTVTPTDTTTTSTGPSASGSTASQTTNNAVTAATTSSTAPTTTPDPSSSPDSSQSNVNAPDSQPAPTNSDSSSSNNDPTTQNQNTATIGNNDNSAATSGNATVSDNQRGGNATSGDADATAALINAIASTSNLSGSGLQTFTYNLNGTNNGNIVIDPNDIMPASTSGAGTGFGQNTVNATNNDTINNNLNLAAKTGDATVSGNGKGGNATSGNATTEADIINLIESLISDKKSFLGVVNINGTLNGNIELPANLIDSLLSRSGGGSSSNPSVIAANNISVNNNVSLTAATGNASVTDNGRGGNAASGDATTKLNIYNLINSQIVGGNVLLVFVNVMGNWYGLLMNAPAGTTSAALGGGIHQDTSVPASQVLATNNETINNNVTLTSTTGNALVSNNGRGGNATTGNATAVADIVNILGAQIDLSGWLGILVINVFGTWNGSLTLAPPTLTHSQTGNGSESGAHHHRHGKTRSSAHHAAGNSWSDGFAYAISYPPAGGNNNIANTSVQILGDSTPTNPSSTKPVVFDHSSNTSSNITIDIIAGGVAALTAGTVGATRYFSARRKQQ